MDDIVRRRFALEDRLTEAQRELEELEMQLGLSDNPADIVDLRDRCRRQSRRVDNLTDRLREADEEITEMLREEYRRERA